MKLSLILPTYNRQVLLLRHLRMLAEQTLHPDLFECVVVDDGSTDDTSTAVQCLKADLPYSLTVCIQVNRGPARARNYGVENASGDIVVLAGDDCLPDRNFLWRHYYAHRRDDGPRAVQGYTRWHPAIPPDDFMRFLDGAGGFQANWRGLRHDDGSWKTDARGWFLTTNVSITKSLFEAEAGFDERFPDAAWEDIEFALRLQKRGARTLFEPDAVNYHYHRYDLDQFVQRQITEGRSRLHLVAAHPELAWDLLDPTNLREYKHDHLGQAVALARVLHYTTEPDVQEQRAQRWAVALRLASLEGVTRAIRERGGAWQAIPHVHRAALAHYVAYAASCLERGDPDMAMLNAEWALREHPDNWALVALRATVCEALGQREEAIVGYRRTVEMAPGEIWPLEGLKRVVSDPRLETGGLW